MLEHDNNSADAQNQINAVQKVGRPKSNTATPTHEEKVKTKAMYRLQVKLTEEGRQRVDELVSRSRHLTAADLVRDALRVYEILVEEITERGGQLYIKDAENGEMEKLRVLP